jgi:hypothetical protein
MPGILRRPPSRGPGRRLRTRFARLLFPTKCGRVVSLMSSRGGQPRDGEKNDRGWFQRADSGVGSGSRRLDAVRRH